MLFAAALPSIAIGDSPLKQLRYEIKELEREQLVKFKGLVRREGDTLYLKTRSGKDAIFKDTAENIDYIDLETYQFIDYLPEHDLYFLRIFVYQSDWVLMISGKTGEKTHIIDPPMISPNKKWLFTVPSEEDFSGIFIWRINDGEFSKVLAHKPKEYAIYSFIKWKGNKTIIISKETHPKGKLCPHTNTMIVPVTLRYEKDNWHLYEDLRPDAVECIQY